MGNTNKRFIWWHSVGKHQTKQLFIIHTFRNDIKPLFQKYWSTNFPHLTKAAMSDKHSNMEQKPQYSSVNCRINFKKKKKKERKKGKETYFGLS